MERIKNIQQEKGTKFLIKAILYKFMFDGTHRKKSSIKDWLEYYQNKSKFHPQPAHVQNIDQFPKVSVIILTYNNLSVTQICLYSIYANTSYPNFELIIVDNASVDETPAWLTRFAELHSNITLILNNENLGFAAGNNQAVREATGEFLIFLNNDTVVTMGWIEGLLSHAREDPTVGLVGPVTNSIGNEARIPVDYTAPAEMEMFAKNRASAMKGQSFDIRMLALYCVLTRKDHFESLGGLDERFGVGMFEDDDLAVRYHQAGLSVICVEDVFIHHFQSMSFSKLKKDYYNKLFSENRKKYEEKWNRKWEPYTLRQEVLDARYLTKMDTNKKQYGVLYYRCNICGRSRRAPIDDLEREKPSCNCGSTVRSRAIIHLLSTELFGQSVALPDFPLRPDIIGWGMSDAGYPRLLSKKLGYTNTYYHQDPHFDISAPLDPKFEGTLDFLISTEVFEHIAPPVSLAFENAHRLLKPTGILIFTAPYTLLSETQEHFPELHQYEIIQHSDAKPILKNITLDGREQVFDNLVFHGGSGNTLEMRVFSENGLLSEFRKAGFDVKICAEPYWDFGIYWKDAWSLPIVASPISQ
ncbi:MAG: glycosyltransferase [Marinirhabdus sp.]|nr:glycosyltransferase [Marinirhabdus sp.]